MIRRLAALLIGLPALALAHGGQPSVTALRFPAALPGAVWAVTDNQGVYTWHDRQTAWLCEDAAAPGAGVLDVAVLDDAGQRFLLLTEAGLFATDDGGCRFHTAPPALAEQTVTALSAHPTRRGEVVAVTQTFGAENDAWWSIDGGGTWHAVGLAQRGRFVALLRSEADPERLYAIHDRGGWSSADGGRTFLPMPLGPPEVDVPASEIRLLAAPPGGPGRVFIAAETFPETLVFASDDAGATWRQALSIADLDLRLAFDQAGREGLLISPFEGARRTMDGGRTWTPEPLPVDRLTRIAREPGRNRLWGATGLFFGGPWALGYSDDFGRTWTPALGRFEDVDARWICGEGAPTARCCGSLCPGLPPEGACGQAADPERMACATPPGPSLPPLPDAGPDAAAPDAMAVDAAVHAAPDAAPDVVVDAAPDVAPDAQPVDAAPDAAPDAREIADARPDQRPPLDQNLAPDTEVVPVAPRTGDDGCQQGRAAPPPLFLLVLLLALRRRRV
ncbi:MAG: hypothetical protein KC620_10480 [Myxococcales bacterium]|nr:hypothetical protein [Myxococcales bacterium]